MKIVEFRAQNFAKLTAVSIRPDGSLIQVTGKNSAGKTSVLHGIWTALVGRAVAPPRPIHSGAEEAHLNLDLGTMRIVRTFKTSKHGEITHDLKVTMADGSRVGVKPQTMIDSLLGDLAFDPLQFAKLPAKDQFERVKALVPGFDFEQNSRERARAFTERTEASRRAKTAQAQADGITLPPGPKPDPIDMNTLGSQLRTGIDQNNNIAAAQRDRDKQQEHIDSLFEQAEFLRAKANTIEQQANALKAEFEKLAPFGPFVDVSALTAQLEGANKISGIIALHDQRARHEREAAEADRLVKTLTAFIEQCDNERKEAVTKAKMPVSELSFGDDEVLLNGLPFSQAGTAEKIRASLAIGMALNPTLKVMLVDEGSELDSDGLSQVAALAEENGYQVWVARVAEGDAAKAGFEIVDGTIGGSP